MLLFQLQILCRDPQSLQLCAFCLFYHNLTKRATPCIIIQYSYDYKEIRMTLQQLRYAVAVADHRSINRAAKEFYLSQPALSGALHELERELSMTLFVRTNRGTEPTPEGAEFLTYARQLLDEAELIEERFVRGKPREKFAVSTQHYTFAVKSFIELIRAVGTEKYDFAISETKTAEVLDAVKMLKSEIGILLCFIPAEVLFPAHDSNRCSPGRLRPL